LVQTIAVGGRRMIDQGRAAMSQRGSAAISYQHVWG